MDTTSQSEWTTLAEEWSRFTKSHPELGYPAGRWAHHNFLRYHREALTAQDAIRKARGRQWIAHRGRFQQAAFDCATRARAVAALIGEGSNGKTLVSDMAHAFYGAGAAT